MFSANDFPNTTAQDCVGLVERYASKTALPFALTPEEKRRALNKRWIKSIALPVPEKCVKAVAQQVGQAQRDCKSNVDAFREIMAQTEPLKYGETNRIITKHKAHRQTVYKMVYDARHGRAGV